MERLNRIDINELPKQARTVFSILIDSGFLVGGAVRDILLGVKPKDFDFATSLHPEKVVELFESYGYQVIPTGIKYGTVTVMIDNEPIEITTFRKDVKYIDGRRPDVVEYAETIEEDLSRRDFTINAMAVDSFGNIIDPYDGQTDLEYKELHCVGNPEERFAEDKLRVLRMFRFWAKYKIVPHRGLFNAIQWEDEDSEYMELKSIDITNLSMERISSEFNKIIMCDSPSYYIKFMGHHGILKQFIPELNKLHFDQRNPHHYASAFNHTMYVLDKVEPKLELRLAALFHDLGKATTRTTDDNGIDHFYVHHVESAKIAREVMTRMKYPNKTIDYVCELVYHHMIRYDKVTRKTARRFLNKVGVDMYEDLIKLMVADRLGSVCGYDDLEKIFRLGFECEQVILEGEAVSVNDLAINGNDLIELGMRQGKQIGVVLSRLESVVLEYPNLNNKDELLELVGDMEDIELDR